MPDQPNVVTRRHTVRLDGETGGFRADLSARGLYDGRDLVTLRLSADAPAVPPPMQLVWMHPTVDVQAKWHPAAVRNRGIRPDWEGGFQSRMVCAAPVFCLHGLDGRNRMTLACSDIVLPLELRAGVHEETAEFKCQILLFGADDRTPAMDHHQIDILIDTRDVPYWDQLKAPPAADGMDVATMPEATARLLADVLAALRGIKPDVLIEFRQPYVGPAMRKYANMLRSYDCPNDAVTNRINTLDVRLMCGRTVAHGDMFMWNVSEPVESAALQILNVLFSVPQVSVLIERLPEEHLAILRFWLGFWREHRDVLLDGELHPLHPESLYPAVVSSTEAKRLVVFYEDIVVQTGPGVPAELLLVNATRGGRVALELDEPLDGRHVEVLDTTGRTVRSERRDWSAGLHRIDVPASGLVRILQTD